MKKQQAAPGAGRRHAARQSARQAKRSGIAKAKAVAPGVAARIGQTPRTRYRGDPDIFGRLVEDHDRHRALFAMLEASDGQSRARRRLFAELTLEIKAHAAAEEQALWSTVLRDPATTEDARHAVAEHKKLDDLFKDLAARDIASRRWLVRLASAKEEYLHHIREEEQEQFVAAERRLRPTDVRHMRQVFNRRKKLEKSAARIEKKIRLKA